jgi:2-keto-4-pentenoate hydratase
MTDGATKAAKYLVHEHESGAAFKPFAAAFGIASIDDAYAVQREYVRLQMRARRTKAIGFKIGLTAKRMQQMCGIDSPVAGVLLADRVLVSGSSVRMADYGRLGLEFEIAIRLARDLLPDGRVLTPSDVAEAVEAVSPAIELVDDRHADYGNLDALSVIADNSWNAGMVRGTFEPVWPDLATIGGVVSVDGNVIDRGMGRDVLGHPFHTVGWLAGHLAERGMPLRAGDIVITGNLVTTKFPDRPGLYHFDLAGLGSVDLSID